MSRSPAARERVRRTFAQQHAHQLRTLQRNVLSNFDVDRLEATGPAVASYVTDLRREFGRGPTWSQLATKLRRDQGTLLPPPPEGANSRLRYMWANAALAALLPLLRASGWVSYTDEKRSLDIGPRVAAHDVENERDLVSCTNERTDA